jgi:hypothetical protein
VISLSSRASADAPPWVMTTPVWIPTRTASRTPSSGSIFAFSFLMVAIRAWPACTARRLSSPSATG